MDTCAPEEFGELVPRDRDIRYDRLAGGALPGGSMPVLRPEQVATASAFLRASALVVHDLRELRVFLAAAAAAGDAVAVREAQ